MTSGALECTGVGVVVAEHRRLLDATSKQLDEAAVNPAETEEAPIQSRCLFVCLLSLWNNNPRSPTPHLTSMAVWLRISPSQFQLL